MLCLTPPRLYNKKQAHTLLAPDNFQISLFFLIPSPFTRIPNISERYKGFSVFRLFRLVFAINENKTKSFAKKSWALSALDPLVLLCFIERFACTS